MQRCCGASRAAAATASALPQYSDFWKAAQLAGSVEKLQRDLGLSAERLAASEKPPRSPPGRCTTRRKWRRCAPRRDIRAIEPRHLAHAARRHAKAGARQVDPRVPPRRRAHDRSPVRVDLAREGVEKRRRSRVACSRPRGAATCSAYIQSRVIRAIRLPLTSSV